MLNPIEIARSAEAPSEGGDPVFKTPWEARIFAMTAYLARNARFDWDDFRTLLVKKIAEELGHDRACDEDNGSAYYLAWLAATEELLSKACICTRDELEHKIHVLSDPHSPGKLSPTGKVATPVSHA